MAVFRYFDLFEQADHAHASADSFDGFPRRLVAERWDFLIEPLAMVPRGDLRLHRLHLLGQLFVWRPRRFYRLAPLRFGQRLLEGFDRILTMPYRRAQPLGEQLLPGPHPPPSHFEPQFIRGQENMAQAAHAAHIGIQVGLVLEFRPVRAQQLVRN